MGAPLRLVLRAVAAIAVLTGVVAIGAVSLLVAVSQGWQRDRVTAEIASRLGDVLGAELRIARLDGALYDGFVARGVVLTAADRPPLAIDALTLRYSLAPLWRERRLAIETAIVDGLDLAVERQAQQWRVSGVAGALGGPEDDTESGPPAIRGVELAHLELRGAHAVLAMDDGATRLDAHLDLSADGLDWTPGEALRLPARATGGIRLDPSQIEGRRIDRAELQLRVADASVRIERADLAGAFGRVTGDGAAELASTALPPRLARARVDATIAALDLAPLAGDPQLTSRLDGTLRAAFAPDDTAHPSAGLLQAELALRAPKLADLDVEALQLRGSFHTGTRAFAIDELVATGAAGELRAHATGVGERVDAAALRADLLIERLPARWRSGSKLAGRVKLAVEGSGSLEDPKGRVEVNATGLRLADTGPGRLALLVTAPGGRALRVEAASFEAPGLAIRSREVAKLRIDPGDTPALVVETLGVAFPGGELHARGRVSSTSFTEFRVDLDERDLAATAAAFGLDARVAGAIQGNLVADGALVHPTLRGSLVASPIAFAEQRFERIEIAVAPEAPRTLVTARLIDGGAERLRVAARVGDEALWSAPGHLLEHNDTEVRIQADALEAGWVASALGRKPGEISGRLDLDALVRGAHGAPVATGTLRLADGRVTADGLREPLGPIDAELRLAGDALRIVSIQIPGGAGAIRASGTLGLRDAALGESDVEIAIDGFEVPKGSPATGRLDGALRLQGIWPAVRLAGHIALADAHVDLGMRRDPVWREIRIHGLPGEEPLAAGATREAEGGFPAVLLPASADVSIAIPPGARVQGNGADLQVAGAVRILKRAGEEPLYLGGIHIVEGRYQFQNRRFELERGTVTLAGTRELDPELDIVAVQKLREVTLRVVVSGRASAPTASLQSDPPLDPSDQLSYLAFGRPASSLSGNDSAQLRSAATQVIGQLVFADLGTGLEGVIPLESIHLEGDEEGVGIGGSIAPGVYLRYAHDLATNSERVGVEWQFRPRWKLRSEAGSDGNAGVDVIWSRDY